MRTASHGALLSLIAARSNRFLPIDLVHALAIELENRTKAAAWQSRTEDNGRRHKDDERHACSFQAA